MGTPGEAHSEVESTKEDLRRRDEGVAKGVEMKKKADQKSQERECVCAATHSSFLVLVGMYKSPTALPPKIFWFRKN